MTIIIDKVPSFYPGFGEFVIERICNMAVTCYHVSVVIKGFNDSYCEQYCTELAPPFNAYNAFV